MKKNKEETEFDQNRAKEQAKDLKIVTQDEIDDEYERELKKFIIPKLRSASYRWKYRSEAIKKARRSRGLYECASCKQLFKNGEFQVDHVEPIIPLEGGDSKDLNKYIRRMLVKTDGWQILCKMCHTIKTDAEVQIRKMYRQRKKDENKS